MPVLRTERLVLREWRDADLDPLARLNGDPAVMEHFPAPMTFEESRHLVATVRRRWHQDGVGWWALELLATGEFIGFVGLARPRFEAPFMPAVEVGWRIAREHWGNGYAPEGARAALRYGFEELALDQIVSFTVPANVSSRRVMEKIGMQHDPTGDFEHPALEPGDRLRPHVLYRLAAVRWRASLPFDASQAEK